MDGVKSGYFEWQRQLVELLPNHIRDALIVRLHTGQCCFDDQLKWQRYCPDIIVDDGVRNLDELLRQSRLYIATYNSTGFLQAFNMNIPTIMIWNPLQWELRTSALPLFSNLAKQGVFHTDPVSAANHIASVWDDIDGWWSSEAVRTCIEEFVAQYSRQPRNLLHDISDCIRTAIGDKG
jgi:putative transferase (TIGR04331 family)